MTLVYLFLLSEEQITITEAPLPLLLKGNGKMGKTKNLLLKAFNTSLQDKYKDLVVVSTDNVSQYRLENNYQQLTENFTHNLQINNYINLVRNTAYGLGLISENSYRRSHLIDYNKFRELFVGDWDLPEIEILYLWEEIQYIIKGSYSYSYKEKGIICLHDYDQENEKKDKIVSNLEADNIYRIAEKYQDWLEENQYWDIGDLTQIVLNKLPSYFRGEYDTIFVDDINNLSDLSLQLLLRLVKINPGQKKT